MNWVVEVDNGARNDKYPHSASSDSLSNAVDEEEELIPYSPHTKNKDGHSDEAENRIPDNGILFEWNKWNEIKIKIYFSCYFFWLWVR